MIVNVQTTAPATTVKAAPVTVIPFDAFGKSILKHQKKADDIAVKSRDMISLELTKFIDLNYQANGRTEAACKALQKSIMDSEVVANSVALGTMERKSWTEYANGAARALYWNVQWTPTLKNDPEMVLPWSKKAKADSTTKAGSVQSTNREALIATLSKALQQARIIGMLEFSADLLDMCIDRIDNFKEIEAK